MQHHLLHQSKILYQDKILRVMNFWIKQGEYYEIEVKECVRIKGMNFENPHENIMFSDMLKNGFTKL